MKNWKTTILGAAIAGGVAARPLLESGHIDLKQLAIAVAIALFGFFSKDSNVTGGTIQQ